MLDFDMLADMAFRIFVLEQVVVFDNGMVVDKNNFIEFISFQFDT